QEGLAGVVEAAAVVVVAGAVLRNGLEHVDAGAGVGGRTGDRAAPAAGVVEAARRGEGEGRRRRSGVVGEAAAGGVVVAVGGGGVVGGLDRDVVGVAVAQLAAGDGVAPAGRAGGEQEGLAGVVEAAAVVVVAGAVLDRDLDLVDAGAGVGGRTGDRAAPAAGVVEAARRGEGEGRRRRSGVVGEAAAGGVVVAVGGGGVVGALHGDVVVVAVAQLAAGDGVAPAGRA